MKSIVCWDVGCWPAFITRGDRSVVFTLEPSHRDSLASLRTPHVSAWEKALVHALAWAARHMVQAKHGESSQKPLVEEEGLDRTCACALERPLPRSDFLFPETDSQFATCSDAAPTSFSGVLCCALPEHPRRPMT